MVPLFLQSGDHEGRQRFIHFEPCPHQPPSVIFLIDIQSAHAILQLLNNMRYLTAVIYNLGGWSKGNMLR